jgi:CRISPR-associated endonuclease/helicase Cas3
MTKAKRYKSKSGRVLSDGDFEAISREVETNDYDVEQLKVRRRGRPPMGSGPADVVPVRLDPELREAVEARAAISATKFESTLEL